MLYGRVSLLCIFLGLLLTSCVAADASEALRKIEETKHTRSAIAPASALAFFAEKVSDKGQSRVLTIPWGGTLVDAQGWVLTSRKRVEEACLALDANDGSGDVTPSATASARDERVGATPEPLPLSDAALDALLTRCSQFLSLRLVYSPQHKGDCGGGHLASPIPYLVQSLSRLTDWRMPPDGVSWARHVLLLRLVVDGDPRWVTHPSKAPSVDTLLPSPASVQEKEKTIAANVAQAVEYRSAGLLLVPSEAKQLGTVMPVEVGGLREIDERELRSYFPNPATVDFSTIEADLGPWFATTGSGFQDSGEFRRDDFDLGTGVYEASSHTLVGMNVDTSAKLSLSDKFSRVTRGFVGKHRVVHFHLRFAEPVLRWIQDARVSVQPPQ